MLGKTNITTLSEGGIVTEIEDFRWIQGQSGIRSDFVKAIFQNGYLAAITADGAIVYSMDGEVWEVVRPDAEGCKLNDIDWEISPGGEQHRRGRNCIGEKRADYVHCRF